MRHFIICIALVAGLSENSFAQWQWARILPSESGIFHGAVGEKTVIAAKDSFLFFSSDGGDTWRSEGKLPALVRIDTGVQKLFESQLFHVWKDDSTCVLHSKVHETNPVTVWDHPKKQITTDKGHTWVNDAIMGQQNPVDWHRLNDSIDIEFSPFGSQDEGFPIYSRLKFKTPVIDTVIGKYTMDDGYWQWCETNDSHIIWFGHDEQPLTVRTNLLSNTTDTLELPVKGTPKFLGGESLILESTSGDYISHDNGTTWDYVNLIMQFGFATNRRGIVLAVNGLAASKSLDGGKTWNDVTGWYPTGSFTIINDSVIYIAAADGIYRTVTADVTLSVDSKPPQETLAAHPNPATHSVFVTEPVRWFDQMGREWNVLRDEQGAAYNTVALPRGVYYLRSSGETVKVVLQ